MEICGIVVFEEKLFEGDDERASMVGKPAES